MKEFFVKNRTVIILLAVLAFVAIAYFASQKKAAQDETQNTPPGTTPDLGDGVSPVSRPAVSMEQQTQNPPPKIMRPGTLPGQGATPIETGPTGPEALTGKTLIKINQKAAALTQSSPAIWNEANHPNRQFFPPGKPVTPEQKTLWFVQYLKNRVMSGEPINSI